MSQRIQPPKDEVVIRAWLRTGGPAPTAVERIGPRRSKKSVLYRLHGAGEGGSPVVAKLCRGKHSHTEQRIYEDVLPQLGIPLPRYYGSVEEPEWLWLFMEDGGSNRCDPGIPEHRVLAARWLARFHGAASRIAGTDLPDRGPAHHLELLRKGRRAVLANLGNPAFDDGHRGVLESLLVECDALEARWEEIEEACGQLPRTLVHGDFCKKNLHIRSGPGGPEFFPMDWEMAGWGVPACDLWPSRREPKLPICDVAEYGAALREHWPDLEPSRLRGIVALGRVFRSLSSLVWVSGDLAYRYPDKPIPAIRIYRDEIGAALRETAWAA
ncbi:MAG: aminoglycoside phosphotransferase family protein [Myxococcota bacterium]